MSVSISLIKELEGIDPKVREVLYLILEEMEHQRKQWEQSVTKTDFNKLKEIVETLSENVAELAKAQKNTEEKIKELAEFQKRTEKRIDRLENTVADLVEAQKKTEQRLNELAEAQKKTEQKVNELAEAQKKTEEELKKLILQHRKTREQLGGLSHTVGYILEDRAYVGLPPILEKEHKLQLISSLKRDFIEISPGRYVEVNIIGKAKRNGKVFYIIGECKTQLKKREVDRFIKHLNLIKDALGEDIFPIIVTYQASPQVQRYVKEKGINLYFSYQFPI